MRLRAIIQVLQGILSIVKSSGFISRVCGKRYHAQKDIQTWTDLIRYSLDADPLLACLLPSLPNLERLKMGLLPRAPYFTQMLRGIVRDNGSLPKTAFKRLKHVWSWDLLANTGVSDKQLALLCKLPSLDSIVACPQPRKATMKKDYIRSHHKIPLRSLKVGSSTITQLALRELQSLPRELVQMVKACSKLRVFALHWKQLPFYGDTSVAYYEHQTLQSILNALKNSAPTLNSLRLEYDEILYLLNYNSHQLLRPLGHLSELTHLRLGVAFAMGLNEETSRNIIVEQSWAPPPLEIGEVRRLRSVINLPGLLPPNLQSLYLICSAMEKISAVLLGAENVIQQARELHPNLTTVHIDYPLCLQSGFLQVLVDGGWADPKKDLGLLLDVQNLARSRGIELVAVNDWPRGYKGVSSGQSTG